MNDFHQAVLWQESLDIMDLRPGLTVVDATVGYAGHGQAILERILPSGFLVAIDQDPEALAAAEERLEACLDSFRDGRRPYVMVHSNFSRIKAILADLGIDQIDAALMDLGVNSRQLDDGERGFSYQHPGRLDMRMNPFAEGPDACDLIREASAEELETIFWRYGEERWSRRVAQFIVAEREKAPIETTDRLVAVIKKAIPAGAREDGPHPAKRLFMSLRISINRELEVLEPAIADMVDLLTPKGRLAVISFHGGEDAIVKSTFRALAAGCTCPKDFPVCVCGKVSQGKTLTAKPILPGLEELETNPRSRSAKLRAFQKRS